MAKSLSQLMTQIEKLQKEAASIQSGVVDRIRKEIAKHGLTAEHLFGSHGSTTASEKAGKPAKSAARKSGAKFSDHSGNSWSGFGPKPAWLRAALETGRSIQEFLVSAASPDPVKKTKASVKSTQPKASKSLKAPKYADTAGHTWGGMGKRPDWIRAALASGKSLDDFLVNKPKLAAPAKKAAPVKAVEAKAPAKVVSLKKKPAKAAVKAKPAAVKSPAGKKAAPANASATRKKAAGKAVKPAAPALKKPKAVKPSKKAGTAASAQDAAASSVQTAA